MSSKDSKGHDRLSKPRPFKIKKNLACMTPGSRSSISSISKTESFKSVGKCFARGIKVLMYDGTHQNVEELNVGNQIMSKNYSAYYKR
ncbi:uncharacterized protein OCT59_009540 [Rhizophagus irregularis]|uniref:Uncharacterized protein n=1 Tax=Rhizophagus irregularis TaxID=588596 RepID=A0A916EKQ0_9GLOM|nr:hypothetical protein OCT59_009540 [Rhizophagus irregularis]CAB4495745.1 unnamed protein product [Rhizophagus irregularis]CAB5213397.1 unnamed protein product [Rhizophagus irregularis]CAB5394742.1 unnamed protein product [Rhizophagus irregularis]